VIDHILFLPRYLLLLVFSLSINFSANATPAIKWSAEWEPAKLVNGSPVLFRVTAPLQLSELQGNFLGQEFSFRSSKACHCWYALAGVSLTTKPGTYTLRVAGTGAGGTETAMSYLVRVSAAHYPFSTIKVAPAFVEPPKEVQPVVVAADMAKKQAFAATDPNPLWAGPFQRPTETETSGIFGTSRIYNGVKKSQHLGLDFRAGTGTPVHATNAGTVILARPLYFEGNCVMLDHGQGLMTVYMHLSEFKVKEGDMVAAGQLIALSGGTGRSTGPHLHFAARWHGEYLDPRTLLELKPPANDTE
jgi:murein DD-endopeptidase MepM/ murein hydrolase activator NlpD